jgi:GcrA cell cycle regulator
MNWTDERVEIASTMWRDGYSAAQIARVLGDVSRNSVIGALHRRGFRRELPSVPAKVAPKPAAKPRTKRAQPKGVMVLPPLRGGNDETIAARVENMKVRANPPEEVLARVRAFAPLPGVKPVPFGSPGCRWPVEGDGADMLCCGAEQDGGPYCAAHAEAAFVPLTAAQKKLARSLRWHMESGRARAAA